MCYPSPDYPCACSEAECEREPYCEACGARQRDEAPLLVVYDPATDTTVLVCARCLP